LNESAVGVDSAAVTTILFGALAAAKLSAAAAPFSGYKEKDAQSGLEVVVLRYDDAKQPARSLEARVAPAAGANLYSLKVGEDELLVQPPSLAELAMSPAGTPVL
jgi:hypothetical protein